MGGTEQRSRRSPDIEQRTIVCQERSCGLGIDVVPRASIIGGREDKTRSSLTSKEMSGRS
jgi:hypothetical protein